MPGRFGQLFSLNKWNHNLKTAFCIYLHYLCVILQFVWWSESFKCDKYTKKKHKSGRGQKPFHATLWNKRNATMWDNKPRGQYYCSEAALS